MDVPYTLSLETESSRDDVMAVHHGLNEYNLAFAPDVSFLPLNIFVRDSDHRVIGGLTGGTFWSWLDIKEFWLRDDLRGQGLGSRLMAMAETEAMRRGCAHALVDTVDFQALPFYQKLGYTVFGELANCPAGHTRYYLQKQLSRDRRQQR